jgi:hypothetical protein
MDTITEIEKQIEAAKVELASTEKEILTAAARQKEAQDATENLKRALTDKKAQRQAGLARGENINNLNADIKKNESEAELMGETFAGTETLLTQLRSRAGELGKVPEGLQKRILQIKSIGLAERYNQAASELAGIVKELTAINFELAKDDTNKERQFIVTFYPKGQGCFEKIHRIFYDPKGLPIEDFISKNPNKHHGNIPVEEGCFFDWASYRNKLIHG